MPVNRAVLLTFKKLQFNIHDFIYDIHFQFSRYELYHT